MKKLSLVIIISTVFLVYSSILKHQHSGSVIAPNPIKQSANNGLTNSNQNGASSTGSSTGSSNQTTTTAYKDGTYKGSVDDAFYGNVQVAAVINGGKIKSVNVLQSPNENPNSIYINSQALPYLKQETVQAQSSNINLITGATLTSQAFIQSLRDALRQAQ